MTIKKIALLILMLVYAITFIVLWHKVKHDK